MSHRSYTMAACLREYTSTRTRSRRSSARAAGRSSATLRAALWRRGRVGASVHAAVSTGQVRMGSSVIRRRVRVCRPTGRGSWWLRSTTSGRATRRATVRYMGLSLAARSVSIGARLAARRAGRTGITSTAATHASWMTGSSCVLAATSERRSGCGHVLTAASSCSIHGAKQFGLRPSLVPAAGAARRYPLQYGAAQRETAGDPADVVGPGGRRG